jgi:CheY-like chemotaxis protein
MNDLMMLREKVKMLSVLIVDDEEKVLKSTVAFMLKFFSRVESALDGRSALRKFSERQGYDIVMTDLIMPGMNGWELAQKLRKMDDGLFIAITSGSPDAMQGQPQLCDVFLSKPIGISDMVRMLQQIIEKRGL